MNLDIFPPTHIHAHICKKGPRGPDEDSKKARATVMVAIVCQLDSVETEDTPSHGEGFFHRLSFGAGVPRRRERNGRSCSVKKPLASASCLFQLKSGRTSKPLGIAG
jgi:hypothetical protein